LLRLRCWEQRGLLKHVAYATGTEVTVALTSRTTTPVILVVIRLTAGNNWSTVQAGSVLLDDAFSGSARQLL